MQVYSWIFDGVYPKLIHVEYHARFQIPAFTILGLPGPEIQEARERIVAAFHASAIEFPKKKLIINLAPASMRKWGTGHDLAIATAILRHTVELEWPPSCLAWGELGLEGEIKPRGQMAALIELLLRNPVHTLLLSPVDAQHFSELLEWRTQNALPLPEFRRLVRIGHLQEFAQKISAAGAETTEIAPRKVPAEATACNASQLLSLAPTLERTLEIALTGRHHLLLLGPKGVGKSHSLEWLKAATPAPAPELSWLRALRDPASLTESMGRAPIRQVHSQVRPAHLLGSWRSHRLDAGELALSHGGVLIADEFPEWPRDARECLREPLQNKRFLLSRVAGKTEVECDFQLVATGNLCPCGGLPPQFHSAAMIAPHLLKKWRCRCSAAEINHYLSKLSGPIVDRVDLTTLLCDFPDPDQKPKPLQDFISKIAQQREFALARWGRLPSELTPAWIEEHMPRTRKVQTLLDRLPSLRARHKTVRIAHTLQSMELAAELREEHLFEASSYRFMDKLALDQA